VKLRSTLTNPKGPARSPEGEESPETRSTNRFRERLSVVILAFVCLTAVTLLKPDGDPDIWARLAAGKLILETGQVVRPDPFSYTPTTPEWIDHEWGAGVVFYIVAAMAGQRGLLLLKASLMFGTLTFMYLRARRATGRPPSLIFHVLLVGAMTLGFVASIRAQAFTFFLFSAWLYVLERAREGRWGFAWLIPLSGVLWANLHGGFLAGVGLIVLFAGGEFIRRGPAARFGALAAITAAASLINPYGFRYWSYLLDATTMDRSTIAEWRPMNLFGSESVFLGFKILLALTAVALIRKAFDRDLPDPGTLATLLVTAAIGLRVARHSTFFIIASAPFVWSWLTSMWRRFAPANSAAHGIPLAIAPVLEASYYGISRGLLLLWTILTLTTTPMRIVLFDEFPVRAVDFIAQNRLHGNLLVPFNFGSYAIWRLYPSCRVSMDGRYETVYQDSTFRAVRNFFGGGPGWSEFLDKFPHEIILSPRNKQVEDNMARRADWVMAYSDERHRVYVPVAQAGEWPPLAPHAGGDPFRTQDKPRYAP